MAVTRPIDLRDVHAVPRKSRGRPESPLPLTSAVFGKPQKSRPFRSLMFAPFASGIPLKVAARVRIPLGVLLETRQMLGVSSFADQGCSDRAPPDTAKIPRDICGTEAARCGETSAVSGIFERACRHLCEVVPS